ncbi:hypothetical protein HMPREF3039_00753 [Akkermansia sp. KLE1798]|nr:hypothetical protein HMPREF3039_00753 [Akkermansia sp. KLE1798]
MAACSWRQSIPEETCEKGERGEKRSRQAEELTDTVSTACFSFLLIE